MSVPQFPLVFPHAGDRVALSSLTPLMEQMGASPDQVFRLAKEVDALDHMPNDGFVTIGQGTSYEKIQAAVREALAHNPENKLYGLADRVTYILSGRLDDNRQADKPRIELSSFTDRLLANAKILGASLDRQTAGTITYEIAKAENGPQANSIPARYSAAGLKTYLGAFIQFHFPALDTEKVSEAAVLAYDPNSSLVPLEESEARYAAQRAREGSIALVQANLISIPSSLIAEYGKLVAELQAINNQVAPGMVYHTLRVQAGELASELGSLLADVQRTGRTSPEGLVSLRNIISETRSLFTLPGVLIAMPGSVVKDASVNTSIIRDAIAQWRSTYLAVPAPLAPTVVAASSFFHSIRPAVNSCISSRVCLIGLAAAGTATVVTGVTIYVALELTDSK